MTRSNSFFNDDFAFVGGVSNGITDALELSLLPYVRTRLIS